MRHRKPLPSNRPLGPTQFEVFQTFGKWSWWIRGPDGTIIAKCLRPLSDKAACLSDIEAIRAAGNDAPIVVLNEGNSK